MPEERLQKLLAHAGVASRRASEEMIEAGRVTVDGQVIRALGVRVDPEKSEVRVDGQRVQFERLRYIVLHKPFGILSGSDPKAGYPSWEELVNVPERLYAVGRLDHDSEGLLLLTNDGELALHLSHPRYEHPKTYLVQVEGVPNARKLRRLQHGVMLDDGPTLPARVVLLKEPPPLFAPPRKSASASGGRERALGRSQGPTPRVSWLKITLREGRKRQVRRMVSLLGHPALRVIRIGLGSLSLGELRPGKWRELTHGEVRSLQEASYRGDSALSEEAPVSNEIHKGNLTKMAPNTIAIDGPSASGKSTIGSLLAKQLGYLYFDTGVMYRAVAAVVLARRISPHDEEAVTAMAEALQIDVLSPTVDDGRDVTVLADGQDVSWDIRKVEVEKAVSPVSAYPGVRDAMCLAQRRIGEAGRIVMVGRDIGTVVMPGADLKIYLDATLPERARRRFLERQARGEVVEFDQVLSDVKRRDEYDSNRQHAPLTAAPDAIVVDTTGLDVGEVMDRVGILIDHWRDRQRARSETRVLSAQNRRRGQAVPRKVRAR